MRGVGVAIGVLFLAGCANSHPSSEPIEVVREPILKGDAAPAPTPVVGIVSELADGGSSRIRCTGTLVAPNVVLTARHCVEDVGIVSCGQEFSGVQEWPTLAIRTDTARHEVVRIHFPDTKKLCGDDIALLVLADAVPPAEAPFAEVRSVAPPVEGEGYSAIGYGKRCTDGGPECAGGIRERRDGLTVECIDCRPKAFRGTTDSICSGDSGGPALDLGGALFGVASAAGIGCTTAYYNRVDAHGAFLRKTVRDETTSAGITAPAWTVEPIDAGPIVDAAPAPEPNETVVPETDKKEAPAPAPPPPAADDGCAVVTVPGRYFDALVIVALVVIARRRRRSTTSTR